MAQLIAKCCAIIFSADELIFLPVERIAKKLWTNLYEISWDMCLAVETRDVHGNGIPNGNGNKTQNWEWEWEGMGNHSVGMRITCTPMGIYSQRFYAAMSLLSY